VQDLLRQRIFGLACGYEDANNVARLLGDQPHKLAVSQACTINRIADYHVSSREAGGCDGQTQHKNGHREMCRRMCGGRWG